MTAPASVEPRRILLVEDSETQALQFRLLLEDEGFEVRVARSAEAAYASLAELRPHLVVADYHLPGAQGDELCRRVRDKLDTRAIPILMLTGDETHAAEQHLLDSGADDFIHKAVDSDILLARIYSLLHKAGDDGLLHFLESSMQAARLLVVDDSATYREMLAIELESEGYAVESAASAEEALALIGAVRFDCVLVDLIMPGMDGAELCRHLAVRRTANAESFVYVMLTASERKDDVLRALAGGADDFVGKSSDAAVLKARIRALLRRKFFQEEARRIFDRLKAQELATLQARADAEQARERAALADRLEATNRELQRSNVALATARLAAEDANLAKSRFLANMSHELRTPLNAIIGYAELLAEELEERGDAAAVADLRRIRTAGNHLLALINDVLDLAKIEAGRTEIETSRVPIDSLLEDLRATLDPLAARTGNRLEIEVPADAGELYSDPTKIRQILLNLVGNACKFTRDGRIRLQVRRVRDGGGERIEMRIEDTGIGMSEEQIGRVFEAFSQADVSTARQYGGTGLGLTLTRRYCELLGGTIDVTSALGAGSTFTVTLPAKLPESAAAQLRPAAVSQVPVVAPDILALVIDDDPVAVDLLTRHLAPIGCEVISASYGSRGVQMAQRLRPDVVILDVMMPGANGWSVLEALKADSATAAIPVVMCTIVDDRQRGFALGASDFLLKPVERDQLLHVMERYRRGPRAGRILIVEDDPATRDTWQRMLERQGWQVSVASDGGDGLAAFERETPDAILLDLLMPVVDGFEFLDRLRAMEAGAQTPVVVVTAMDLDEIARARLDGRVHGVIERQGRDIASVLAQVRNLVESAVREGARHASPVAVSTEATS